MSPREFFRELVVAKTRREERHDRDMALAWHVAALTRGTKGLPKLETLLHHASASTRQSPVEQIAMWQVIAARFGGTFTPIDPNEVTRGH